MNRINKAMKKLMSCLVVFAAVIAYSAEVQSANKDTRRPAKVAVQNKTVSQKKTDVDAQQKEKKLRELELENKQLNEMIVKLRSQIDELNQAIVSLREQLAEDTRLIVLTVHRRENLGGPMREIFEGIRMLAEAYPDVRIVYPMHPNVRAVAQECLGECSQVYLSDPLDVIPFHNIMSRSYFILTDSGGIQEEASFLEKPVLVLRDATERPENLKYGVSKLVGTDKTSLLRESGKLLDDPEAYKAMTGHPHIYGDGHASERIAAHIHDVFYGKE